MLHVQYIQSHFESDEVMWLLFAGTQTKCWWHFRKWDLGLVRHSNFWQQFESQILWKGGLLCRILKKSHSLCFKPLKSACSCLLLTLFFATSPLRQNHVTQSSLLLEQPHAHQTETDRVTLKLIILGLHCWEFIIKKANVIGQDIFRISSLSWK